MHLVTVTAYPFHTGEPERDFQIKKRCTLARHSAQLATMKPPGFSSELGCKDKHQNPSSCLA